MRLSLFEHLESEGAQKSEKIAFKCVYIYFLAIHITNTKLSFDIPNIFKMSSWNMIFT